MSNLIPQPEVRKVFMEPPKEMKKQGIIWEIVRSVYRIYHKNRKLSGILIVWVDNFFYSGDAYFYKDVVNETEVFR